MDPNQLIPTTSSPFSVPGRSSGPGPIVMVLIALLGLGTVGFGIATLVFANKASTATNTTNAKIATAVSNARDAQKQKDDETYTKIAESPYRTYNAPTQYGSFTINFPKTWSSAVTEARSGTQVNLTLNPNFLRKVDNVEALIAIRVMLLEQTNAQALEAYSSQIKSGKIKKASITVSGQTGSDLTGTFPDKRTVRRVIIPVRDKVITFTTENKDYASQFNEVLAQAKIIP